MKQKSKLKTINYKLFYEELQCCSVFLILFIHLFICLFIDLLLLFFFIIIKLSVHWKSSQLMNHKIMAVAYYQRKREKRKKRDPLLLVLFFLFFKFGHYVFNLFSSYSSFQNIILHHSSIYYYNYVDSRCVFRSQPNIYNAGFLQKLLTAEVCSIGF